MKRWMLLLLVLFLLSGCGEKSTEADALGASQAEESIVPVYRVELSELEVQTMFLEYAEADWVMIDCVSVTDSAYGIVGVVQYTTDDYDGCRFDFLRMDGPLKAGVGASPAGEDRLVYMGGDTVSCELIKDDGELFICSVTYYESESEIGFEISG